MENANGIFQNPTVSTPGSQMDQLVISVSYGSEFDYLIKNSCCPLLPPFFNICTGNAN